MTAVRIVTSTFLVCVLAVPARGHSVVIYSGRITWQKDRLQLDIDCNDHLLSHEALAFDSVLSYRRWAEELARGLHVVTEAGQKLSLTQVVLRDENAGAVFTFAVTPDVETVALYHRPVGPLATLQRQIQFRYTGSSKLAPRLLQLTSGGNYAVIRRGRLSTDRIRPIDPFLEPVIRLSFNEEDSSLRSTFDVPCALLATWRGLSMDDERVHAGWLGEHTSRVSAWMRSNLDCTNPDGAPRPWTIESLKFLAAAGDSLDLHPSAIGSIYTTRLRVTVGVASSPGHTWCLLSWGGFNHAMMRVSVVWDDAHATRIGELTPTQNIIRIEGPEPSNVFVTSLSGEAPAGPTAIPGSSNGR